MLINSIPDSIVATNTAAQPQMPLSLDRVAVIILGGGEGKRLYPLTKSRCKPTISFGGRYTLIDIPISHSLTSGLSKIFVVGQYLAYSLQKHPFKTYLYHGISQNQIQLLVPEERTGQKIWYQGTADAVRKNLDYLSEVATDYFLILSGDQLYNINFLQMINFAVQNQADMVIAAQPVDEKHAKRMGVLKLEPGNSKIVDFYEKPQEGDILRQFYTDNFTLERLGYGDKGSKNYLGSMGIYLFKREALFKLLQEDKREDFGKHLIMTQMKKGKTHAFLYDGYWEDIGTIESYYHANLALTQAHMDRKTGLECYGEKWLIMTKRYNLPGSQVSHCTVDRALLCEGSVIEGAEISHSVIGVRSLIETGTTIRDSIIVGNEYYEKQPIIAGDPVIQPKIGRNCLIQKAIIDENVTIGNHVQLTNRAGHTNFDSLDEKVVVRDGIIVIPRGTHIPDNYVF